MASSDHTNLKCLNDMASDMDDNHSFIHKSGIITIPSNIVIDDIKSKSGLLFEQAKDFEVLAKLTLEVTQRSIVITTLKRLLGYIDDDHRTNSYTLNTLALYLGYSTWDAYLLALSVDSIWGFQDAAVYVKS